MFGLVEVARIVSLRKQRCEVFTIEEEACAERVVFQIKARLLQIFCMLTFL